MTHQYDVAILGGGLAANLFARQLKQAMPQLSVGLFEKSVERSFKVGESSVEIASNFFIRKLGLSTYMYDEQLAKNGLRFFFDTPEKNTNFFEMSEVGSDKLPIFPTFQIDRARFEADLLEMNRKDGVDLHIGVTVKDLKVFEGAVTDRMEYRHSFKIESKDGHKEEIKARWLVDAAGRSMLVSKHRGLKMHEKHANGAVWGRFENVTDMDSLNPKDSNGKHSWRERTRYTSRVLSTNHFCYKGYWIWFIPIARGITSVGYVGDGFEPSMRSEEGFWKFLRQHGAPSGLLENAKMLDVDSYARYAYATSKFFQAKERWALIGEAAAFSDPFYSPGSDYISIESDMITDLIKRDFEGSSENELHEQSELYDAFMQFRFEATMLLYRNQYPSLGSFETMKLKWNFDIACYYNLWLDFFLRDHHLSARDLRTQLRRKDYVLSALGEFNQLQQTLVKELENSPNKQNYFRKNLGHYNNGTDLLYFQDEIGRERKKGAVNMRTEEIFRFVKEQSSEILGRPVTLKTDFDIFANMAEGSA